MRSPTDPIEAAEVPAAAELAERVRGRWQALMGRDVDAAYAFASPAYRALVSPKQYRSRFGTDLEWTDAEIVRIEPAAEDAARVGIQLHFRYHQLAPEQTVEMTSQLTESWIRSDGQWWHIPDD